jgi:hypothetical protein
VSGTESGLSRRQAFSVAALAGAGTLTAMMPVGAAAAESERGRPEGAWLVVAKDILSGTLTEVLYLVIKGGGVSAVSDSPARTGSTGFGAWEPAGNDQFRSTFEQFSFDASGQVTGILRVRTVATVDPNTDGMSGRALVEFQPHGSPQFIPVSRTTFTGTRIKVLPF